MVGHIVLKNAVATNLEKFDKILKLPFLIIKKALRNFLGMVGYYQRFIHMFVAKTRPLTRFLREDARTPMEDETSKCAFEQFKSNLQNYTYISHFKLEQTILKIL